MPLWNIINRWGNEKTITSYFKWIKMIEKNETKHDNLINDTVKAQMRISLLLEFLYW